MDIGIRNGWRTPKTSESSGSNFLGLLRSYPNTIPRERIHMGNVHSGKRAMVISSLKKANISASRKQRIKLEINGEKELTFSEFLKHPSGMEAVINAKALQSYHLVDDSDDTYRFFL
jgi:hypothetical protein